MVSLSFFVLFCFVLLILFFIFLLKEYPLFPPFIIVSPEKNVLFLFFIMSPHPGLPLLGGNNSSKYFMVGETSASKQEIKRERKKKRKAKLVEKCCIIIT